MVSMAQDTDIGDGRGAWRAVALVGVPLFLIGALLLPILVLHERLPDPLATHWGISGTPNGHMALMPLLLFLLVPWLVLLTSLGVAQIRGDAWRLLPVTYAVGLVLAAVSGSVVWANLDVPMWFQARSLGLGLVLEALALILVGILLAKAIARRAWPRKAGPAAFERIVRCSAGHLFVTTWMPGLSLKAARLWTNKRFQRCPVGKHWKIVTLVDESLLRDAERVEAAKHRQVAVP